MRLQRRKIPGLECCDSDFDSLGRRLYLEDGRCHYRTSTAARLYVMNRMNEVQRVIIPPDCMAVQMGRYWCHGWCRLQRPVSRCQACSRQYCSRTARIVICPVLSTPQPFPSTIPSGCHTWNQVIDSGCQRQGSSFTSSGGRKMVCPLRTFFCKIPFPCITAGTK
jgi:hypothetical protein